MRIMDLVFFINVVLLGLLSVHDAHAQGGGGGCMQDLAKNEDFMRCSQGFAEIILQMQQSAPTEPADTTALYVAFCSPEGRSVLKCVMDFVFECPEIQTMMAGSAEMGMNFTEIVKQGGIDVFCEMTTSFTVLPTVVLVPGQSLGCTKIIEQNAEYLRCMQSFHSLFSEMAAAGKIRKNESAVVICGEEGKAAIGCVFEYLRKCPHLAGEDDESGVHDIIYDIRFVGDLGSYCEMVDEGCAETYMECTALMNPKRDGGDIFGEVHIVGSETAMTVDSGPAYEQMSTFFSNVPKQITILCGPMEEMLTNCAFRNNVKTECPKSVGFIEHAIGQMIIKQNNMNGTVQPLWSNFPAYEEAKKYILKKCPTLPDSLQLLKCTLLRAFYLPSLFEDWTHADEAVLY